MIFLTIQKKEKYHGNQTNGSQVSNTVKI